MKFAIPAGMICLLFLLNGAAAERPRARDFGIHIGVLPSGPLNAITDVKGVKIGHVTLIRGESIRTGVTAVLPHDGNMFQEKVPAAVSIANGFGKLTGTTQIEELGQLETPIILTNTLSIPTAAAALISYTLGLPGNETVVSVNAVVGETNDSFLNDIRLRAVTEKHVLEAIQNAAGGPVQEGSVGAGTGTTCHGFKGGIGTASRILPDKAGGYTVGILVQTNHGGNLRIPGLSVGDRLKEILRAPADDTLPEGSCMVIVATDAPLDSRNLKRLAKRALLGIARGGGYYSNSSGDYAIAFSTAKKNRIPHRSQERILSGEFLANNTVSPLFMAAAEATEEAILNSMFQSPSMTGRDGNSALSIPLEKIKSLMEGRRLE
ncbi:MAG: P1 family peptidase [Candidatus Aminicenantes bacterium]|nr:P1 family peptidase [Candidatus Aminicenantes bacterium]